MKTQTILSCLVALAALQPLGALAFAAEGQSSSDKVGAAPSNLALEKEDTQDIECDQDASLKHSDHDHDHEHECD
ncbi:MAG: hypothetical protein F6J87_27260 [Spirulina sp. SIO3F2]|nr:hypothetical protein [Spirulina sp. SIO3F2]